MGGIQEWAAALCVAAIACSLLQLFAPKNGTGKILRLIITGVFLCCMLAPLLQLKAVGSLELPDLPNGVDGEVLDRKIEEQLKRQVSQAVQQLSQRLLEKQKMTAEKIEVKVDTAENGSIYIEQVIVYLDKQSSSRATTARLLLQQELGVSVMVVRADGKGESYGKQTEEVGF